jgi:hypothetical protein
MNRPVEEEKRLVYVFSACRRHVPSRLTQSSMTSRNRGYPRLAFRSGPDTLRCRLQVHRLYAYDLLAVDTPNVKSRKPAAMISLNLLHNVRSEQRVESREHTQARSDDL